MLDLKGALDMLMTADAALKRKAADINDLLLKGTEEDTQQALALQESLDTLQADYNAKKALYDKLVQVNSPSDVAKLFVPASPTNPNGDEKPKGVMTRKELAALEPNARMTFMKGGGKLVE